MARVRAGARVVLVGAWLAGCGPEQGQSDTSTEASSNGTSEGDPTTGGAPPPTTAVSEDGTTAPGTTTMDATTGPAVTTEPETTTTATTGTEEVCPCIVNEPDGGTTAPMLPTCAAETCAVVTVNCSPDCGEFTLTTPEALTCALEALRDRTPGLLRWSLDAGPTTDHGYVWIHDDGTAIWRRWGWEGLGFQVSPAQIVALPASEVYTQCLGEGSDDARFDCLRQELAGARDPVCDEGWDGEGI